MTKFAYDNMKNASTSYMPFKLNCSYHSCISYEKNVNPLLKSKSGEELANKLRNLMTVYRKNLQYTQDLQKQYYDKATNPRNSSPDDKFCITNTSKPSRIKNLRLSFLDLFEYCIW